jgi:hypothetical protein
VSCYSYELHSTFSLAAADGVVERGIVSHIRGHSFIHTKFTQLYLAAADGVVERGIVSHIRGHSPTVSKGVSVRCVPEFRVLGLGFRV